MNLIEELLVCDAPQSLQIEITSRCNLKCKMCPLTTGSTISSASPDHMAEGLQRDILPIARRYRKVILAGYGEPLLNPHLLPFLKELDQAKVEIGMSTNGTLLTASIARKLATLKYLVALNVSIDSPEEDSYRHIRGGQVEKALTGLKNLMAVIDEPQKVSVSAVLMRHNIKHLVETWS